jgi:hypothetical protein
MALAIIGNAFERSTSLHTKTTTDFVLAPEGLAAAGESKNRLSRDSPGRSIFDFCNNIGTNRASSDGLNKSGDFR